MWDRFPAGTVLPLVSLRRSLFFDPRVVARREPIRLGPDPEPMPARRGPLRSATLAAPRRFAPKPRARRHVYSARAPLLQGFDFPARPRASRALGSGTPPPVPAFPPVAPSILLRVVPTCYAD